MTSVPSLAPVGAPTGVLSDSVGVPSRLSVLGPLTVTVGGDGVPTPGSRQRRMLAILAAAAGRDRSISVDDLVDAMYGERAPQRPRHSVATELWRTRRLLGPNAISTDGDRHRIDPDHCLVDLVEFERLLDRGRANLHEHDDAAAERDLALALQLWHGDPLVDWQDHPAGRAAAERLIELRLGCIEDHAQALMALGHHAPAIDALDDLTVAHPTREHAWALLVESCAHDGQLPRARTAYDSARRTLSEYGSDVGAELSAAAQLLDGSLPPTAHPRLFGRDRETALIVEAIARSRRCCEPTAVLVTGEAGIGKTALIDRATEAIGDGAAGKPALIRISCDLRIDLPFGAIIPMLRELAAIAGELPPAIGALLSPTAAPESGGRVVDMPTTMNASRSSLREAICELIEAAATAVGGLVIVVEDAHWAQAATLDALDRLLARRSRAPVCVLVAARDPVELPHAVAAGLAALRRRADQVVSLTGLDVDGTTEMLGSDAESDDAARMHRLTGGNPLYLSRLAALERSAARSRAYLPSLTGAIAEHLSTLPDRTVTVLQVAAVIGASFDTRILTAAAARPPLRLGSIAVAEALASADGAGFLRRVGDGVTHEGHINFAHELVRDYLYQQMPADDRSAAHVAVAEATERITVGSRAPVDLLAHHYSRGWPACSTADAVSHLRTAGSHAAAQLDFDRAYGYYRRALDLTAMDPEFTDVPAVADLLAAAGQASTAADDLDGARDAHSALYGLADRNGLQDSRLSAGLGLLQTYSGQRVDEAAIDSLAAALRSAVGGITDHRPEPALLAEAAAALHTYRPSEARSLIRAVTESDPASAEPVLLTLWEQQSVADQVHTAHRLTDGQPADALGAWLRVWVSDVAAGKREMTDVPAPITDRSGSTERSRLELALWRITVATATGDLRAAERLIATAEQQSYRPATATQSATRAAALIGQRERLADLLGDKSNTARRPAERHASWTSRHAITRFVRAAFDTSVPGGDLLDDLADEMLDGTVPEADLLTRGALLAMASTRAGHRRGIDTCRAILEPHRGHHAVFYFTQYWGAVEYHLGRLSLAAGDFDAAVDDLHAAIDAHGTVGARSYQVYSRQCLATALWHRAARADRSAATAEHQRAAKLARTIGMDGALRAPWPPAPE